LSHLTKKVLLKTQPNLYQLLFSLPIRILLKVCDYTLCKFYLILICRNVHYLIIIHLKLYFFYLYIIILIYFACSFNLHNGIFILRARSIYERALDTDHRNITLWLKYAELEMRHRQVMHARNLWDRAVVIMPRANQFWYKYTYMEEMLGNVAGKIKLNNLHFFYYYFIQRK